MSIRVAESAGFCFGVNRAVELVEQAAASGKRVCTLGPIIHNRHAVSHFREMGVEVIDKPEQAQPGQTVIIRSHGVTRAVQEALEARGSLVCCLLHLQVVKVPTSVLQWVLQLWAVCWFQQYFQCMWYRQFTAISQQTEL